MNILTYFLLEHACLLLPNQQKRLIGTNDHHVNSSVMIDVSGSQVQGLVLQKGGKL